MKNGVQKMGRVQRKVIRDARSEEIMHKQKVAHEREQRRQTRLHKERQQELLGEPYEPRLPIRRDPHKGFH